MNADVNARNAALYNRHANKAVDQAQAEQQREQGDAVPVKKFHNGVKRLLLQRFAGGRDRLLDIACGRGGDLLKWIDCKLKYVRGYDIAAQEIEEAKKRFSEVLGKAESDPKFACAKQLTTEFLHSTDIGTKVWSAGDPYDAVTCMFALHYFFQNEKSATTAIELAAQNLREGGHFFGVLPSAQYIMDACKSPVTGKIEAQYTKQFVLVPRWHGMPAPFGSAYNFTIKDTVTQGEEDAEGSFEYLVYQSVLVDIARRFDLHPVVEYGPELDAILEPAETRKDGKSLFRQFKTDIPGLHASLQLASRVNCAFVFRKGKPDGGGALKRKRDDVEQSEEALRAAADRRVATARLAATPGTRIDGSLTGVHGVTGSNNAASSLATEDDLVFDNSIAGQRPISEGERRNTVQSSVKRSSRFQRAR